MPNKPLRTSVYIDGFNFYYGQLKSSPWKWLDLPELFDHVLGPQNVVTKVKYFTARVQPTPTDPNVHIRQDTYFRALNHHCPRVEVQYGHFLRHKVRMEHAKPPPDRVEVWKNEEKGSDVNLALHVLNDAWRNDYDCAVIVSNDSDLAEALRLVKAQHNKAIGLITPGAPTRKTSMQLKKHADIMRTIRESALRKAQLPIAIPSTNIRKPEHW